MERWRGKVAIVTGASSGIGASIVEQLVEHGLKVAGLARRVERVQEIADRLKGKPGELHAVKCDVSKEAEILTAFKWVKDQLGPVSVFVNNAAVYKVGVITELDNSDLRNVLDTNLLAATFASKEAIKQMVEHKIDGHIILINSISGHAIPFFNYPFYNLYYVSKYGMTALNETLRQELIYLKTKIKITSISPGVVATEMIDSIVKESNGEFNAQEAASLDPEDIAEGVIYALSTKPHVQVHELTIKPVGEVLI